MKGEPGGEFTYVWYRAGERELEPDPCPKVDVSLFNVSLFRRSILAWTKN